MILCDSIVSTIVSISWSEYFFFLHMELSTSSSCSMLITWHSEMLSFPLIIAEEFEKQRILCIGTLGKMLFINCSWRRICVMGLEAPYAEPSSSLYRIHFPSALMSIVPFQSFVSIITIPAGVAKIWSYSWGSSINSGLRSKIQSYLYLLSQSPLISNMCLPSFDAINHLIMY